MKKWVYFNGILFFGTKYNVLQLVFLLKHFDILVTVFLFDCVTVQNSIKERVCF